MTGCLRNKRGPGTQDNTNTNEASYSSFARCAVHIFELRTRPTFEVVLRHKYSALLVFKHSFEDEPRRSAIYSERRSPRSLAVKRRNRLAARYGTLRDSDDRESERMVPERARSERSQGRVQAWEGEEKGCRRGLSPRW